MAHIPDNRPLNDIYVFGGRGSEIHLCALPAEIRNHIWRYALQSDTSLLRATQPPLCAVNRRLRNETLSIFYGENVFSFSVDTEATWKDAVAWFTVHLQQVRYIRSISTSGLPSGDGAGFQLDVSVHLEQDARVRLNGIEGKRLDRHACQWLTESRVIKLMEMLVDHFDIATRKIDRWSGKPDDWELVLRALRETYTWRVVKQALTGEDE